MTLRQASSVPPRSTGTRSACSSPPRVIGDVTGDLQGIAELVDVFLTSRGQHESRTPFKRL
jgi:hypothetical protein